MEGADTVTLWILFMLNPLGSTAYIFPSYVTCHVRALTIETARNPRCVSIQVSGP